MSCHTKRSAAKIAATALVLIIGWAASIGAQGNADNAATQRLLVCDAIADPDEKLACFTAVVESLKSAPTAPSVDSPAPSASDSDALPAAAQTTSPVPQEPSSPVPDAPTPAAQTTSAEPLDESPDAREGVLEIVEVPSVADSENLYRGAREKEDPYESLPFEATIVGIRVNQDGRFSVVLDNGQIWRETQGPRVGTPKEGQAVEVYKGRAGGYRMKIDGVPRVAWVRRTK